MSLSDSARGVPESPVRRSVMIEVSWWDCGDDAHRHKTEEVAMRCLLKSGALARRHAKANLTRRNLAITRSVLNGETLRDVGISVDLSPERCRQITWKTLRLIAGKIGLFDNMRPYQIVPTARKHKDKILECIDEIERGGTW